MILRLTGIDQFNDLYEELKQMNITLDCEHSWHRVSYRNFVMATDIQLGDIDHKLATYLKLKYNLTDV
jgi:hypothetical protein